MRSDEVVAVDPIAENRGTGRRTHVWVRGVPEPLVASPSDGALVDDLVTPAEEAARMRQLRSALSSVAKALEDVPAVLQRVIREESGVDLPALMEESRRALG